MAVRIPSRRTTRLVLGLAACAAAGGALPATGTAAPRAIAATDTLYPRQTALQRGAAIGAPEAWKVATGTGTIVAVLDTGVDASHPDLRGAIWTNPAEIPGNGIDDDNNGFVDDAHGVDLVNRDGNPADDEGHGTHVAGIIAARANGTGVIGLAPETTIMPIKVLDARCGGTTDTLAEGIRYALAHGATVISVSVNGVGTSSVLRSALQAASAAGVSVVASAGNDGQDLGVTPSYPASYPDPAVLAVAATDGDSVRASFSNFGRGVTLAAPGVDIVSTAMGGGYEMRSGTSMAAPEVAAALALLHSARPDLSDAVLRDALVSSARRTLALTGIVSAGALDVAAALHRILPASAWSQAAPDPVMTVRVRRRSSGSAARARTLVTWSVAGDTSRIRGFRLGTRGGRTLARRRGESARGAWVARRTGAIVVTALDGTGAPVTSASVVLR